MRAGKSAILWPVVLFGTILGSFSQEEDIQICLADGTCQKRKICEDLHGSCDSWSDKGECGANPGYMLRNCPLSCDVCDPDEDDGYEVGEIDLGVNQVMSSSRFSSSEIMSDVARAWAYMRTAKLRKSVREICKNQNEMCTIWALKGECKLNPNYMKRNCAPACQSCDFLSTETRCPIDPNAPRAWIEGDLDRLFEKLTQEPYLSTYSVEILSSPATNGPWVITMENIVNAAEAERLIELGSETGYERSKGMAKIRPDGTPEHIISQARTSSHTWCRYECSQDAIARSVIQRLSNVTGIDEINSEYLQLLQYQPGQYYTTHHDYLKNEVKRQQGNRILTLYLYLNDVEEGGGTNFDKLNITVMPKRGRALIWPSVKSEAPRTKDYRTTHQALPVEKGIKYGANAWFHIHDFKTPHQNGCTE